MGLRVILVSMEAILQTAAALVALSFSWPSEGKNALIQRFISHEEYRLNLVCLELTSVSGPSVLLLALSGACMALSSGCRLLGLSALLQ